MAAEQPTKSSNAIVINNKKPINDFIMVPFQNLLSTSGNQERQGIVNEVRGDKRKQSSGLKKND